MNKKYISPVADVDALRAEDVLTVSIGDYSDENKTVARVSINDLFITN